MERRKRQKSKGGSQINNRDCVAVVWVEAAKVVAMSLAVAGLLVQDIVLVDSELRQTLVTIHKECAQLGYDH